MFFHLLLETDGRIRLMQCAAGRHVINETLLVARVRADSTLSHAMVFLLRMQAILRKKGCWNCFAPRQEESLAILSIKRRTELNLQGELILR